MSITVHEALLNAQANMENVVRMFGHPIATIAKNQMDNALAAIESGKGLYDELPDDPQEVLQ